MKAAVVEAAGAAPTFAEFPDPPESERHTVVDLVAAGIHPIVRARVAGRHYSTSGTWPAVPGVDAVARTPDGRLVYTGFVDVPWGTMAQRMSVPSDFGTPLPDGVDPLAVAAGVNPGLASWLPLARRHEELGGTGLGSVVVLGATGMAGRLAVENALSLGATTVVAVGRNADVLAEVARRDPERIATVALTGSGDSAAMTSALAERPPTTVIDFVWGNVAAAAFRALGDPTLDTPEFDVCHIEIGTMAGADASVPGALLRSRRYTLRGSGLGGTPLAEIRRRLPEFIDRIATGAVRVPYTAFPLSRVAQAWESSNGTRAVVVPV